MRTIIGYKKDALSAPKVLTPVVIDESGDVYLENKRLGKLGSVYDINLHLFKYEEKYPELDGFVLWLDQNKEIYYEQIGIVDSKLRALQDHIRVLRSELIPEPKYRFELSLDPEDGMNREDARKEAHRLANLLNVKVIYDFNGKTFEVIPNES